MNEFWLILVFGIKLFNKRLLVGGILILFIKEAVFNAKLGTAKLLDCMEGDKTGFAVGMVVAVLGRAKFVLLFDKLASRFRILVTI